nr:hypothetical protein [Tanacetum cinerariifolium]
MDSAGLRPLLPYLRYYKSLLKKKSDWIVTLPGGPPSGSGPSRSRGLSSVIPRLLQNQSINVAMSPVCASSESSGGGGDGGTWADPEAPGALEASEGPAGAGGGSG